MDTPGAAGRVGAPAVGLVLANEVTAVPVTGIELTLPTVADGAATALSGI